MSESAIEDRVLEREGDASHYAFKLEDCPRWVRVMVGGVTIADSKRVKLLHESKHMPIYYFPVDDVRMDLMEPSGRTQDFESKGTATYLTISAGDKTVQHGAWTFYEPTATAGELKGMVAFYWRRMDHWFEEDDEVFVHPRDPYHRVDVLNSSRHVQVVMLGEVVADTRRPRLLFETNLPTRYYFPLVDVKMDALVPSSTTTQCPYKGDAEYFSVRVGNKLAKDVAWFYKHPTVECPKIENLIAFYHEQVDAIIVDGEEQPKPRTVWAKPARIVTLDE